MAVIAVPEIVMVPHRHLEPTSRMVLSVLPFAIPITYHLLLEDEALLYLLGEIDVVGLYSKKQYIEG
jgi:hypothetical protein